MDVPRVFGFGSATLTFRVGPTGGARPGSDLLAGETTTELGGATANALVQAARLGLHAAWLGKLGNDWLGQRILDGLEDEGVDCAAAVLDPKLCSPFHLVAPGAATVRLPNSLARLQLPELEFLADRIDPGEWVLVELGELPLAAVSAFCARVRRREARILMTVDLDPIHQLGADPVDLQMLLAQADLLVPNAEAIRPLCETDNPEIMAIDLARRYHCVAVLHTPAGSWYAAASGLGDGFPADLFEPVDPDGSEDAFRGGLLAGLAQGQSLPAALHLASQCAQRTAARPGPRTGMPRATELALDDHF